MPARQLSLAASWARGRSRQRTMSVPRRSRSRSAARATNARIQYVMDTNKETKREGIYSGVSYYNAAASAAGDIVRTIPSIATGDGDSNRDGRLIKLMKHTMRGCVAIQNSATAAATPKLYVDIWMVEDKYQKNFALVDAATAFLVRTNNSFVPVNPGSSTFWEEVGWGLNRDRFIIRRKRVALTNYKNETTTLQDPTTAVMRTFSFTRKFKKGKTLQYQSDADTLPSNYNCYMFFSVGSYDDTYYGSLSNTTIKASVNSMFYFKDK